LPRLLTLSAFDRTLFSPFECYTTRLLYRLAGAISNVQAPERDIESELLARLGLEAEVRFVEPQITPKPPAKP